MAHVTKRLGKQKNMTYRNFLHGYDCLTQGKTCSDKAGLIIYVDNKYRSEIKLNLNMYEH